MKEKPCPKCGTMNNDNWPITVNEKILFGGCQDCWEKECEKQWWDIMHPQNRKELP
jgi:hypothetical protein